MNDILLYIRVLYIRNFAYLHECTLYSNNAAMQKALSPFFVAIVERQSHCFSPIEELSATECQRLASAAVTDTAETESGWQVSFVTANTTYTVSSQWLQGSQWSSRSAEDVITQLQVQHSMCCHMNDSLQRH